MRVLAEASDRAVHVEINDAIDEDLDGGWDDVTGLWHVGHTFPTKHAAARAPGATLLSTWYLGDATAEHAKEMLAAARSFPKLTELHLHIEPDEPEVFVPILSKLPALKVLGLRVSGVEAKTIAWLFESDLPIPAKLRLAVNRSIDGFATYVAGGLDAAPAHVAEVEVSFDFGWSGWLVRARRDDAGRFAKLAFEVRKMPDKRFAAAKVSDLVTWLDAMPSDRIVELSLDVDGVRMTKPDIDALRTALARHVALKASRIGSDTTLPARGAPSPTSREREADASQNAHQKLREQAQSVAGTAFATLAPGSYADAAAALAARADRAEAPSAEWTELALASLELPMSDEALVIAALRLLERAPPPGIARRIVAVLEQEDGRGTEIVYRTQNGPLRYLPPAELPVLLDWYETRPDKGGTLNTRHWATNEWIQNIVAANGDGSTWNLLAARIPKVSKWKAGVYEFIQSLLAERANAEPAAVARKKRDAAKPGTAKTAKTAKKSKKTKT